MTEFPTLEGRVMADLGHQVADLRAKLQQVEAERSRLQQERDGWHRTWTASDAAYLDAEMRAEQAEADNARLRSSLELVLQMVATISIPRVDIRTTIDAALTETR